MPDSYLQAVLKDGQTVNRLFTYLNARLTLARDGTAVVEAPASESFRQGGGVLAGGILATLADEAMAHAVLSAIYPATAAATTEMSIRYLRGADPATAGMLTAKAGLIKKGRSLCFAEATVYDGKERPLAKAGATFYVPRQESAACPGGA